MTELTSLLRPNARAVLQAAQQYLQRQESATRAPVVRWLAGGESAEGFAARLAPLAFSGRLVLAVVPFAFSAPSCARSVELPQKLFELLHPDRPSRYRCASGGRGSAKSHSIATVLVLLALTRRLRILCAREIMRSLRESVHHLLCEKIDTLGLSRFFSITDRSIECTLTGSEIIFAGLWAHINTLKSLENISLVWIEESESVSQRSLEVLTPTVRAPASEIWLSCNPDAVDAPVMQFIGGERPDTRHVHVTYADNPWFTETPLEAEREYLQRVDDDAYRHVWLGECRRNTDAQVFAKKYTVEPFTVGDDWDGPYHGLDLGFKDPSVLTKCWVSGNRLYIEREAWQLNCDIDRLPALLDQVSGARDHVIRCDSARPETISYLKQHGYPDVVSVEKWPDSVEDGVARMRAFEMIVVHPDCVRTLDEMRLYSYKVDRLTGDVMPDIVDRHNHCIDSIRYGIAPLIKRAAGQGIIEYYQQQNAANAAAKASTSPAAEVAPQPARRPLFEIAARRGGIMRDI